MKKFEKELQRQNLLKIPTRKEIIYEYQRWDICDGNVRRSNDQRHSKTIMPRVNLRGGVITTFRSNFFLSHSTEKLRWGTLRCFRKFRVSKNFMHKKGISLNSVEKSLSHSADKIRRRTLLCFERNLVSKIFKQRGGASRFCRKFFISQDRKTSPGNHSVFQTISGREKYFMDKRRGYHVFRRKVFVSLYRKYRNISLENTLVFQKNSFIENFHALEGGGASRFCRNFLSHRTEKKSFVKEPFCFPEIFWYRKKIMDKGGLPRFSIEIFMSHSAENFREGILLFFEWFQKVLWMKRGVSRFSVENFWSHSEEKFRGHPFRVSENLGYRKILCIIGGITIFRRKFFVSQ